MKDGINSCPSPSDLMNILFVSNLFPPAHIGGYELACRDTVDLLSAAGHACHVLTSDFSAQGTGSSDKNTHYPIERVMLLHHNWGATHAVAAFDAVQQHNLECLGEAITRVCPQVIYFWNLYGLGWQLLQALDQVGAPPATFHFMDWSVMAYQRTFRTLLSSFRGKGSTLWGNVRPKIRNAIFISRFTSQQLGLSPRCASVIYPYLRSDGIPEKRDYRLGETIRTVYIGQIEPHKGIFFLCEALKSYRQTTGRDVRLDVYGLSRNGKDTLLREQFGDFVSVMTNVDRSSLLQRLAKYDLGFFPSLWEEPFGIAQIEMMQAGLPVISSGRGGSGEVANKNNLLLYQYNSKLSLIERLNSLVSNFEYLGSQIGCEARLSVLKNHNEKSYLLQIETHLEKVVEFSRASLFSRINMKIDLVSKLKKIKIKYALIVGRLLQSLQARIGAEPLTWRIRREIGGQLYKRFDGKIKYGVFQGQRLGLNEWWGRYDIAPMLLGTYEMHVQNKLKALAQKDALFVDIGAADGFYAVGAVSSGLYARAVCFEISSTGREMIKKNCVANNVENLVKIRGEVNKEELIGEINKWLGRVVILCDIEGGEFVLFNTELLQELCECSVIIELHDFSEDRSREKDLCRLAEKYFHIEYVKELPVDPSSIPELSVYDNESRLLSLSEGRPFIMNWLLLNPKSKNYFENRV